MIQIIIYFFAIIGVASFFCHIADVITWVQMLGYGIKRAFGFKKQKRRVENCGYNNLPKFRNPLPPPPKDRVIKEGSQPERPRVYVDTNKTERKM